MRLLDRYRFELSGACGTAPVRLRAETTEVAGMGPRCALVRRAEEVLGSGPWHRSTCELWLPESAVPPADYYGIHYVPCGVMTDMKNGSGDRAPESVYLEVHRNRLPLDKPGTRALFFVATWQQANDRIVSIAQRYGFFERDDEASTDALTNLKFAIIGGGDIPPLTDWQEHDDEE